MQYIFFLCVLKYIVLVYVISIYMYAFIYVCVCVCIYIYRERERERAHMCASLVAHLVKNPPVMQETLV